MFFTLAPCKPENTSVQQNCSSNYMTVRWNPSNTTQNYTVKAMSAAGINSTCKSPERHCTFLNLTCGQLYTFTVVGHSNVCMSAMSSPIEELTGKLKSPQQPHSLTSFKQKASFCPFFFQPHVLLPTSRLSTTAPRIKLWSAGEARLHPQATASWPPPPVGKTPPVATWAPPVSSLIWPVDGSILLSWRQCTVAALVPPALLSRSPQVIRLRGSKKLGR